MTLTVRVPVSAKADPVKKAIARSATGIHVGGVTERRPPRRDLWLGMVRGAPFLEMGSVTIWLRLCRFVVPKSRQFIARCLFVREPWHVQKPTRAGNETQKP